MTRPHHATPEDAQRSPNEAFRVDFLLIGAQKSGTTSLWQHIAAHPQTFVPANKEVEFFSHPERYRNGIDWYGKTYFANAPAKSRKGEATTQYMMFPEVPARIHQAFPDVKLIALLRNPIDRAYSHYRMTHMRGHETRRFEACVDTLSQGAATPRAIDADHDYLRLGEYGRILEHYLAHFGAEQMCVLFTENLERDPEGVTRQTYEFLEIDAEFRPDTLGKRFNVGGTQPFPAGVELLRRTVGRVRRLPGVGRLITRDRYEAFKFWTRTELKVHTTKDEGLDVRLRKRLAEYFSDDVQKLRRILLVEPPWPEFDDARANGR